MSETRLFVRVRGRVIGPFSLDQLRALRERGQFHRFHEVSEDRRRWVSAATLGEVFPAEDDGHTPRLAGEVTPAAGVEWFYVNAQGDQAGPVPEGELLALLGRGDVRPATLVWKEGMARWTPFAETGLTAGRPPHAASGTPGARREGLAALNGFLADPVGGLAPLCEAFGNAGALALGFVFTVLFTIGFVVGLILVVGGPEHLDRVPPVLRGDFAKPLAGPEDHSPTVKLKFLWLTALAAVLLLVSLAGAIGLIRLIVSGKGRFGFDLFIASAYWLPLGLLLPVFGLLGVGNLEVIVFLGLFVSSLQLLILNSGFTRVIGLSDRGALLAIPASLVLSIWLCKIVVFMLISHSVVF